MRMGQTPVQHRAQNPQRRIGVEHQLECAHLADAGKLKKIRHCRSQCTGRHGKRADQAVAREGSGSLLVSHTVRQHGVLDRHQHAEIAGRRIHRTDERHQRDERKLLDVWERQSRACHKACAYQQQGPQIVARSDRSDNQSQQRRAEQRGRGDEPDLHGVVTDRSEISRQDDDGEAVAKAAHPARRVKHADVRSNCHAKPPIITAIS